VANGGAPLVGSARDRAALLSMPGREDPCGADSSPRVLPVEITCPEALTNAPGPAAGGPEGAATAQTRT